MFGSPGRTHEAASTRAPTSTTHIRQTPTGRSARRGRGPEWRSRSASPRRGSSSPRGRSTLWPSIVTPLCGWGDRRFLCRGRDYHLDITCDLRNTTLARTRASGAVPGVDGDADRSPGAAVTSAVVRTATAPRRCRRRSGWCRRAGRPGARCPGTATRRADGARRPRRQPAAFGPGHEERVRARSSAGGRWVVQPSRAAESSVGRARRGRAPVAPSWRSRPAMSSAVRAARACGLVAGRG